MQGRKALNSSQEAPTHTAPAAPLFGAQRAFVDGTVGLQPAVPPVCGVEYGQPTRNSAVFSENHERLLKYGKAVQSYPCHPNSARCPGNPWLLTKWCILAGSGRPGRGFCVDFAKGMAEKSFRFNHTFRMMVEPPRRVRPLKEETVLAEGEP